MAVAGDRLGIGIRRHFTTEGVDPYDEVQWERRDSRITDYRDGSVAFEQLGVEVPSTWSMNATNILAQKYFRGTLGTPERESSLRQVVDRVVGSITRWGQKDGYFVDDVEAAAFAAELRHIIVSQKAAFNSPVWFNIGVKGVPQQAAACFILAVDDQMDSILNWYVEEGTIFKGGSGAGTNLSRIRSSKELLRGGGTASGPVSFMRGADSSAGTIKCLHGDTPIVTTTGVKPIREVEVGTQVVTRHGLRRVLDRHDNGIRPLVRVRTELGDEVRCTPEHRFWVRRGGVEQWVEAGALEADDHLLVDMSGTDAGRLQELLPVDLGYRTEIAHRLPTVLDEPFALWLGWLFGDGSITRRNSANFIAMQIADGDGEAGDRYRSLVGHLFGDVNVFTSRHHDKPDASASVRFCSTQVIRFLEANGLLEESARTVRVPLAVQSSPAAVRAAFLSGLFEADGHVGNGYPTLSSVSHDLAVDVHRMLSSLGIPSIIGQIDDRVAAYGDNPVFTVRVIGGEGVRRFAKLVGFVSERKHKRLEEAVARKDARTFESKWVLPGAVEELDRVWLAGDARLRRGVAPYCRFGAPHGLSLLRGRALVVEFPDAFAGSRVERFALGLEYWTTASVEPAGEAETFDLTVDDVHEYLVCGLVTHNSGGKTRRAAKMVILDADHPDVQEFIWCKAKEERKARVLSDAGFDMDLDGADSHSLQYQNANNSVRLTDEFMQAVLDDGEWSLVARTTGEVVETLPARALFRQIAEAAWECADPGLQFDTTINKWHTAPNTGRINASNPCFPASAKVHTDKGLVAFGELFQRVQQGESFAVYTHDATSVDEPQERVVLSGPEAFMITGFNEIVRLRFDNGMELRCTPGHRLYTVNRGFVEAQELTSDDDVKLLDLPAPAVNAGLELPVPTDPAAYHAAGDKPGVVRLPQEWTPEFADYLGWMVGDGSLTQSMAVTIYGSAEDRDEILPGHAELVEWVNGDRPLKVSEQANGTQQLRIGRRPFRRFLEQLGVKPVRGPEKTVPWAIEQAPPEIVAAFLRGLFDADGCAVMNPAKGSYVGLGSTSPELLRGVQSLLTTFGVSCRIYKVHGGTESGHLPYVNKKGETVTYGRAPSYDLRITSKSMAAFAANIGFTLSRKAALLREAVVGGAFGAYDVRRTARLVERTAEGTELTFNLSEPRNHSYIVDGIVVRNCSEYVHLDNSSCNLASINLLNFFQEDGSFDVEGFKAAVEVVFTAQEILVGNADYPTKAIGDTTRKFRQLGLGYANLGALLMAEGIPYDSDAGRAWAASITALMTGHAYAVSARTAARMGPFAGFHENAEAMVDVLRMHRAEVAHIDEELVPTALLSAAQEAWDSAVELAEIHGVRNSQATVLAPTGTISFLMDCDTTGIEPDLGLVKTKKLVGGGTMSIVNQTVPRALRKLGYSDSQVAEIVAYIDEHKSIVGAPHMRAEHLPVFACSMGDNTIHYAGHVKMMSAAQPFISGAISKTVNMPQDVTVEDVEQLHIDAWKLGLKAVAIYRDNCKVAQPLSTTKKESAATPAAPIVVAGDPALLSRIAELEAAVLAKGVDAPAATTRKRLPRRRNSKTFAFRVADCEGYVTVGEYEDGHPGEVFMKVSKQGSTLSGVMDAFSIAVSLGLQHGVPLSTFVRKYTNMRFEPAGITDDVELRLASSLVDYIFRRLALEYLDWDDRVELGVLSTEERTQPTLPGLEDTYLGDAARVEREHFGDGGDSVEPAPAPTLFEERVVAQPESRDAPFCYACGNVMQRAGSCYACPSCGATSGCS